MISHQHKCIFVHIPKVAGQSIELLFLQLHNLDWSKRAQLLLRPNDRPELGPPRLAHLKLNDYVNYHYISHELFQEYFKFAFVRNPWSRTVSFYKYGGFNQQMSFRTFVENKLPKLIKKKKWFYAPQYDFLYAKDNSTKIDFIGRFENLNKDMLKVCKRLNITFNQLPHRNESKVVHKKDIKRLMKSIIQNPKRLITKAPDQIDSRNYKDYYNENIINIIAELYHLDVEAFNYSFENTHNKT